MVTNFCFVTLLVLFRSFSDASAQHSNQLFNVIFILADDLGWGDLSYNGNSQIPTPNIDVLAQDGVILANHYSQPICTPSRAALMTGAYPIRYGLQGQRLRAYQRAGLNTSFKIMPEYFKEAGFSTHMIGKWHLGFYQQKYVPTRRGFDTFLGSYNDGIDYWNHFHFDAITGQNALDLHVNDIPFWNVSGQYATHIYKKHLNNILQRESGSGVPFFIYLAPNNVHCSNADGTVQTPMEHYEQFSYINKPARIKHAGNVQELDIMVGELMYMLKKYNLLSRTIIAFASDNGGAPIGYSYNSSPNYPFRGAKGTVAEGGVHTPAFFWAPHLQKRGVVNTQLFHITDWLPTLIHAAGKDGSALRCKDGVDQWDVLMSGAQSPRTEILIQYNQQTNQYALRNQNFKIMFDGQNPLFYHYDWYKPEGQPNPDPATVTMARQRCMTAKILNCFHGKTFTINPQLSLLQNVFPPVNGMNRGGACNPQGSPCLFDLSTDPYEMNNIYEQNTAKYNELFQRLQFYSREAKPLVNQIVDPKSNPYLDSSGFWKTWVQDNDNTMPELHA